MPNEDTAIHIDALRPRLEEAETGALILLELPLARTAEGAVDAVVLLRELGYRGVYVTLGKDVGTLMPMLIAQQGPEGTKNLAFIDGISSMYGIGHVRSAEIVYVPGPLSIDRILAEIEHLLSSASETKRFVFIDSLTILLLYNGLERTAQFGRDFREVLMKHGAIGVLTLVSSGANAEVIDRIKALGGELIIVS